MGGKVTSGCEGTSFNGEMISREGDRVACPACGTEGFIALTGPHLHEEWNGKQAALEGDLCICKCDPPPELIANQRFQISGVRSPTSTCHPDCNEADCIRLAPCELCRARCVESCR
ncbi:PAAR domain-containing protein [Pseudomonas lactis]|uniref:PAAR domain-containing protein n=1 Tax=Pseudomonas lactis TaxID=1615674 RepID=UPI0030B93AF4